ncbi:MAG: heavy metal-associated domain-containing protein [Gemmatimonadaceae bacterium]|nr:heavy metal-associated domain-containing protein [Gemmatimonadaceae bacterium]
MITTLYIDGMISVHCARAVFTSLARIDGIASADVSMGRAVIEHDGRATKIALDEAVSAVGYLVREVVEERRRLTIRDDAHDAE